MDIKIPSVQNHQITSLTLITTMLSHRLRLLPPICATPSDWASSVGGEPTSNELLNRLSNIYDDLSIHRNLEVTRLIYSYWSIANQSSIGPLPSSLLCPIHILVFGEQALHVECGSPEAFRRCVNCHFLITQWFSLLYMTPLRYMLIFVNIIMFSHHEACRVQSDQ